MTLDSWRLAVGMFTVWPTKPPVEAIDRRMGRRSIVLAPLAVLPLAATAVVVMLAGRALDLTPLVIGVATVAAIGLGNRGFHLDGLADTADAFAVWGDAEKSHLVRKSGDVGPAGAAALALVLLAQVAGVAALATNPWGPLAVAVAVCVSRASAAIGCSRVVPAARSTGLGAMHAATVPVWEATLVWFAASAALVAACVVADIDWWRPVAASFLGLLTLAWLLHRSVRRLGGVVGDVLGAGIEISFAVLVAIVA